MNLARLLSNKGGRLRLRPPAFIVNVEGATEDRDDLWLLTDVRGDSVHLVNERTQHSVPLSPDHVHSYTSSAPKSNFDGFLELKVTIDITSSEASVDIIPSGAAKNIIREPAQSLRTRLELLLDCVNPEIRRTAASRRGPVAVMMGIENLQRLNELRRQPGFSELAVVSSNGNVCIGSGNQVSGHIHDVDALGTLHGVVLQFRDNIG